MSTINGDMYGDRDFDPVPDGKYRGLPWSAVPAETLRMVIRSLDSGLFKLDPRRVEAIRRGLREKEVSDE